MASTPSNNIASSSTQSFTLIRIHLHSHAILSSTQHISLTRNIHMTNEVMTDWQLSHEDCGNTTHQLLLTYVQHLSESLYFTHTLLSSTQHLSLNRNIHLTVEIMTDWCLTHEDWQCNSSTLNHSCITLSFSSSLIIFSHSHTQTHPPTTTTLTFT